MTNRTPAQPRVGAYVRFGIPNTEAGMNRTLNRTLMAGSERDTEHSSEHGRTEPGSRSRTEQDETRGPAVRAKYRVHSLVAKAFPDRCQGKSPPTSSYTCDIAQPPVVSVGFRELASHGR